jgi:hypothetical protein
MKGNRKGNVREGEELLHFFVKRRDRYSRGREGQGRMRG